MAEKTRILFVLDASGSMLSKWDGDLRINIAKDKLALLVDSLKVNKNVEFALRVYGHQFDSKLKNCKDSKLEVGFEPNNYLKIKQALTKIAPKGTTPIAYSLEQATMDFPDDKNYRNVIIMITDGIEACNGDPCAISLGLQRRGVILRPFIIGLGVGKDFTQAFECIGKAIDARNIGEFTQALSMIATQTLGKTTVAVELLDDKDKTIEKDVNMSFINHVTKEGVYDLVHFRDKQGKTDLLEIDPVLNYDLVVNTIPPVSKENIEIQGGKHNVIKVKTPQGTLKFVMKTTKEYGNLQAIIRQNNTSQTLHHQPVEMNEKYLIGKYDIEVLTRPRLYYNNVEIKAGQTTELAIADPGILNIVNMIDGYASLYIIDNQGQPSFVENIAPSTEKSENIIMQPGNYKLVFRAKTAVSSAYTVVKKFVINSGKTTYIDILK
ncbi:MAG: VWA domain-containing protein [Thermoflexibacter sp.]|nr:VWA domain-containing protein [Thermoflexibacter sp.]